MSFHNISDTDSEALFNVDGNASLKIPDDAPDDDEDAAPDDDEDAAPEDDEDAAPEDDEDPYIPEEYAERRGLCDKLREDPEEASTPTRQSRLEKWQTANRKP